MTRFFWLSALVMLSLLPSAWAADDAAAPAAPVEPQPGTTSSADASGTEFRLRPFPLKRPSTRDGLISVSFLGVTDEPAGPPTVERREKEKTRLDLGTAIWGAGIGLTVGLLNGHDEAEATLIGAGTGFALPYLLFLAGAMMGGLPPLAAGGTPSLTDVPTDGAAPVTLRSLYAPGEGLRIFGQRPRGEIGDLLPRVLWGATLGLAVIRADSVGRLEARRVGSDAVPIVSYGVRW